MSSQEPSVKFCLYPTLRQGSSFIDGPFVAKTTIIGMKITLSKNIETIIAKFIASIAK